MLSVDFMFRVSKKHAILSETHQNASREERRERRRVARFLVFVSLVRAYCPVTQGYRGDGLTCKIKISECVPMMRMGENQNKVRSSIIDSSFMHSFLVFSSALFYVDDRSYPRSIQK